VFSQSCFSRTCWSDQGHALTPSDTDADVSQGRLLSGQPLVIDVGQVIGRQRVPRPGVVLKRTCTGERVLRLRLRCGGNLGKDLLREGYVGCAQCLVQSEKDGCLKMPLPQLRRFAQQRERIAVTDNLTFCQDDKAVRIQGFFRELGYVENGRFTFRMDLSEEASEILSAPRIEQYFGSIAMTLAMARRCFSPPESR